jgi:SAM-dependent methyltransferase
LFGILNTNAKNILVQGIFQKNLLKFAKQYFTGSLIDIGCGTKPYKNLLSPFVSEHTGLDHKDSFHDQSNVDLFGTAYDIPCEDQSFDSALCSAVLEHLEEPELAIRECFRVLKPNGHAIYSIPFIWHLHEEPRDFYRYSKYGIRYLFEKSGFEIVELEALSGFWVTFGQLFVYNIYRFNCGPLRWFRIITVIGLLIQGIVYLMDKIDKTEQWTWMYMVVAKKPL